MKLLFAAPDRDLLACYRRLLTREDRQVDTAFDGTQVIQCMARDRYELAILSSDLPRVGWQRLAGLLHEAQVPVILMTLDPPEEAPGEAVFASLPLPFLPEDLNALLDRALGAEKGGVMA